MSPRKLDLALSLAIVLEVLEILRRLPVWLIAAAACLAVGLVVLVLAYAPWVALALVAVVLWKLGRGFVQGFRGVGSGGG